MLGESRWALGLLPLAATAGCGLIIAHLGNRLFGAPAGWLAAILFLTTPVVLLEALDPMIDGIELFLILGGAALLLHANDKHSLPRFLLAGLIFGLAFQARETSVAALPAVGLFLLLRTPRPFAYGTVFAAGFLLPLAAEMLVYGLATGDPLLRRALSLAHTSLPSSEIAVASAPTTLPFFRWSLIAGWQHELGISVHWLVDGPLDVLLNPKGGWMLLTAIALLLLFWRRIEVRNQRLATAIALIGAFHALILIYALSIDPKPRMMLVPLAAASMILGALLPRLPRWTWLLLALAKLAALASAYLFEPRMGPGETAAREWLAALPPGSVEITESTRRRLALLPAAEGLPLADGSRPLLLTRSGKACADSPLHDLARPGDLLIMREARLGRANPFHGRTRALCLFRYADRAAALRLASRHDATSPFTDDALEKAAATPPSR